MFLEGSDLLFSCPGLEKNKCLFYKCISTQKWFTSTVLLCECYKIIFKTIAGNSFLPDSC